MKYSIDKSRSSIDKSSSSICLCKWFPRVVFWNLFTFFPISFNSYGYLWIFMFQWTISCPCERDWGCAVCVDLFVLCTRWIEKWKGCLFKWLWIAVTRRMKEDSMKDDSMREDSTKEDSMREDSMRKDFTKEDSMREDSMKEDSMKDDSMLDWLRTGKIWNWLRLASLIIGYPLDTIREDCNTFNVNASW